MGLILDTSILIDGERNGRSPKLILQKLHATLGETEFSLSAISILELEHGIYRSDSPARSQARRQFSLDVCEISSVIPVTIEIAKVAGRVEGQQAARGFAIPLADLLIGCTALYFGLSVVTFNPKHFELIPDLQVLTP